MQVKVLAGLLMVFGCAVLLKGQGFKPAGQISERCLQCLCEASTECNEDIGCSVDGPNQYLCGPYAISYQYWKDGGSPGKNPSDPLDFEQCLNDKSCAEAAIKGYMYRWAQDCNGDGYIDCYDWALLHKAGPTLCNGTWAQKSDFWFSFTTCYANN